MPPAGPVRSLKSAGRVRPPLLELCLTVRMRSCCGHRPSQGGFMVQASKTANKGVYRRTSSTGRQTRREANQGKQKAQTRGGLVEDSLGHIKMHPTTPQRLRRRRMIACFFETSCCPFPWSSPWGWGHKPHCLEVGPSTRVNGEWGFMNYDFMRPPNKAHPITATDSPPHRNSLSVG